MLDNQATRKPTEQSFSHSVTGRSSTGKKQGLIALSLDPNKFLKWETFKFDKYSRHVYKLDDTNTLSCPKWYNSGLKGNKKNQV